MKVLPISTKVYILNPGDFVYLLLPDGSLDRKEIRSVRNHHDFSILSFPDILTPEQAVLYRNSIISVDRSSVALDEWEYFYETIIGLSVTTETGEIIGTVWGILETGSNDVYIVRHNDKEYLIPAIKEIIKFIDVPGGKIIIRPIEGLID